MSKSYIEGLQPFGVSAGLDLVVFILVVIVVVLVVLAPAHGGCVVSREDGHSASGAWVAATTTDDHGVVGGECGALKYTNTVVTLRFGILLSYPAFFCDFERETRMICAQCLIATLVMIYNGHAITDIVYFALDFYGQVP